MAVRVALPVALLLALFCTACEGLDNNYKYKYTVSKDTIRTIASVASSYQDERSSLLDSYTGNAARNCKADLFKRNLDQSTVNNLNTKVTAAENQVKNIDNQTYQESQKCGGSQTCIKSAVDKGTARLSTLNDKYSSDLSTTKENSLQDIKVFMEDCLGN